MNRALADCSFFLFSFKGLADEDCGGCAEAGSAAGKVADEFVVEVLGKRNVDAFCAHSRAGAEFFGQGEFSVKVTTEDVGDRFASLVRGVGEFGVEASDEFYRQIDVAPDMCRRGRNGDGFVAGRFDVFHIFES